MGAFFLALAAFLLAWVPYAGIALAITLGVLAVLLGIGARFHIRQARTTPKGIGFTTAAFVLAVAALPLALIFHFAVWGPLQEPKAEISVSHAARDCNRPGLFGNCHNFTVHIDNTASRRDFDTAASHWTARGSPFSDGAAAVEGPSKIKAGKEGTVVLYFQPFDDHVSYTTLRYTLTDWNHPLEASVPSY